MKKLMTLFLSLFFISCTEKPKSGFSLIGKTNGIQNGTVLYLDNTLTRKPLDTAVIENNSFNFETDLPHPPLLAVLRTKDYTHYRYLWLEDNAMTLDVSTANFRNANVTGSQSEDLSQVLRQDVDSLQRDERLKREMEFVAKNPSSIVSAHILYIYSTTWGKEKTSELFGKLSDDNKASEYGKRIDDFIRLNQNQEIGAMFADFAMSDQNGNAKKLSSLKGKTILLEFWASWCGPCRQENPNLVKTYERFKPKGFEVFAVSLDSDKNDWLTAIEKDSLSWLHVSDLKGQDNEAALIYGINGIPDNFLIDLNGVIIGRNLRGEKLNGKLAQLLTSQ
jgi:peroxiredoxin